MTLRSEFIPLRTSHPRLSAPQLAMRRSPSSIAAISFIGKLRPSRVPKALSPASPCREKNLKTRFRRHPCRCKHPSLHVHQRLRLFPPTCFAQSHGGPYHGLLPPTISSRERCPRTAPEPDNGLGTSTETISPALVATRLRRVCPSAGLTTQSTI